MLHGYFYMASVVWRYFAEYFHFFPRSMTKKWHLSNVFYIHTTFFAFLCFCFDGFSKSCWWIFILVNNGKEITLSVLNWILGKWSSKIWGFVPLLFWHWVAPKLVKIFKHLLNDILGLVELCLNMKTAANWGNVWKLEDQSYSWLCFTFKHISSKHFKCFKCFGCFSFLKLLFAICPFYIIVVY